MPHDLPVSRAFNDRLVSVNGLDALDFDEWLLQPGMMSGSLSKWWGGKEKRAGPHEGLDLCSYLTRRGEVRHLDENTKVPVVFSGEVVGIIDDFLGHSVFVRHTASKCEHRLYTVYGHVKPLDRIRPGTELAEGEIIGTIANARVKNSAIPPHLHISVTWVPDGLQEQKLDWDVIADPHKVVLIDPLTVIRCPYTVAERV